MSMSSPANYGGTANGDHGVNLASPADHPANARRTTTPRVQHLRDNDSSGSSRHQRPQSPAPSGVWSDDETEEDEEATPLVFEVEPGIDPSKEDFSDLYNKPHLGITVADWSSEKAKVRQDMSNEKFMKWLDRPRPSWSKARWISMNGLHWDVFKKMALKYELQ